LFGIGAALAMAGCGSGADTTSGGLSNADGSFLTCATDIRAVPYQPGMHVTSDAGTFIVKLLQSVPGPPVKGQNTFTVEVDQADTGAPLDGLDITVTPWMPDHGHGTTPVAVTAAANSGSYTLAPVYTYMSGFWQIQFTIAGMLAEAGTTDTAMIPICIN
jgi:hypothetical protein